MFCFLVFQRPIEKEIFSREKSCLFANNKNNKNNMDTKKKNLKKKKKKIKKPKKPKPKKPNRNPLFYYYPLLPIIFFSFCVFLFTARHPLEKKTQNVSFFFFFSSFAKSKRILSHCYHSPKALQNTPLSSNQKPPFSNPPQNQPCINPYKP